MKGRSTPYEIGYRFERRIIKMYEKEGYFVIRQGKSKFPDIVAFSPNKKDKPLFIECKVNIKNLKEEEKIKLFALATKYNGTALIYYRIKRKVHLLAATSSSGRKIAWGSMEGFWGVNV